LQLIDTDLLSANKRILNLGLELMGARTLQRLAARTMHGRTAPRARPTSTRNVMEKGLKEAFKERDSKFGDGGRGSEAGDAPTSAAPHRTELRKSPACRRSLAMVAVSPSRSRWVKGCVKNDASLSATSPASTSRVRTTKSRQSVARRSVACGTRRTNRPVSSPSMMLVTLVGWNLETLSDLAEGQTPVRLTTAASALRIGERQSEGFEGSVETCASRSLLRGHDRGDRRHRRPRPPSQWDSQCARLSASDRMEALWPHRYTRTSNHRRPYEMTDWQKRYDDAPKR